MIITRQQQSFQQKCVQKQEQIPFFRYSIQTYAGKDQEWKATHGLALLGMGDHASPNKRVLNSE